MIFRRLFCFFGLHDWQPKEVFHTQFVKDDGSHDSYVCHFTGHICLLCERRELKERVNSATRASVGERRNAYNWLHEKTQPKKSATVLRLVR